MVTRLYVIFLGLLFALFIGVGIAAFYHAPKAPEYPVTKADTPMATSPATNAHFQVLQKQYEADSKLYNRNVSLAALIGAVIFVALGLTALKSVTVINDSLLLGGVFTLVYSIIRGFGAGDDAFRFVLVSTSLAIAILLGYLKLIKPMETARHKAK